MSRDGRPPPRRRTRVPLGPMLGGIILAVVVAALIGAWLVGG